MRRIYPKIKKIQPQLVDAPEYTACILAFLMKYFFVKFLFFALCTYLDYTNLKKKKGVILISKTICVVYFGTS